MDETGLVRLNRERHDAVAAEYDARHPEIHNPTEQRRLSSSLSAALAAVTCANPRALDFGSGTGNLTVKLLSAGWETWAADVSPGMLALLQQRFPEAVRDGSLRTVLLDGGFPLPFPDEHFGFAASYSVLHHVPDYLAAVRELTRIVGRGGVLYIDHEHNADHWRSPPGVRVHRMLTLPRYSLGRVRARLLKLLGRPEPPLPPPGQREVCEEGDIHIYADDCIDWDAIRAVLNAAGFQELPFRDYLLCRETSRLPLRWWLCRAFAADMGIYVGRKA